MSSLSYACVTLALICTILPTPGSCTSFEVEAGQTFSIYLTDVKEGESIGLRYQVLHGGMMDIDVVFVEPDGSQFYSNERQGEEVVSFRARISGNYRFDFSNAMSSVTTKEIDLQLEKSGKEKKGAKPEHLSPIEDEILILESEVRKLKNDVMFVYNQEMKHRDTSENMNSRVVYVTVFEGVMLILVNIWQIFALRRFFEVKRTI